MYHQIMTTIIWIHIHDVIHDVTKSQNRPNFEIDMGQATKLWLISCQWASILGKFKLWIIRLQNLVLNIKNVTVWNNKR